MIDFYFWPTPNAYKVAVMLAKGIPGPRSQQNCAPWDTPGP